MKRIAALLFALTLTVTAVGCGSDGAGQLSFTWSNNGYSYRGGQMVVEQGGKYGVLDKAGAVVVPIEYDYVSGFSEGYMAVQKDGKWGFIDTNLNTAVPFIYDGADSFSEGFAVVQKNGKYAFVDKTGKEIVPFIYEYIFSFGEGVSFAIKDGKAGYIDTAGNAVIPFIYDDTKTEPTVKYCADGIVWMRKDGKVGFVDKTGRELTPFIYSWTDGFRDGLARTGKDKKHGFIDKDGNEAVPFIYDNSGGFYEGLAFVKQRDAYGYVDKTGNVVIPCEYRSVRDFSEGLATVMNWEGKWGFIDKAGNAAIPFLYDSAGSFHEGLASVVIDGKYGFIDKSGSVAVPLIYDAVWDFHEGFAEVKKDGKMGLINREGTAVIPVMYDSVAEWGDGMVKITDAGVKSYVDTSALEYGNPAPVAGYTSVDKVPDEWTAWSAEDDIKTQPAQNAQSTSYVSLGGVTYCIGDTMDIVIDTLGWPQRIDPSVFGFDWYIYNADYSRFIMIGIKDYVIAGIYTNAKGFEACGARYGGNSVTGVPGVQYYYDGGNDYKLYAVLIAPPLDSVSLSYGDELLYAQELENHDAVNAFRVNYGLMPLSYDENARAAARKHSQDMADRVFNSHYNPEGLSPADRYQATGGTHMCAAENITGGHLLGIDAFDSLVNSAEHRKHLLGDYLYLGVGVGYNASSEYCYYYTQLFCR